MSRFLDLWSHVPAPLRRAAKAMPGAERLRRRLAGHPRGPAPAPGSLRPVVYLPTWLRWDEMRQRPQYLLAAFAEAGHPVWFVDPREPEERVVDGVRIVRSLRPVPARDVILYVHFAPMRVLFDLFDDPVVVYDILDDLTLYEADEVGVPADRRVAHHHPHLMETADVVLASNRVLAERHHPERPDIVLVENGVDVTRFAGPRQRPEDVPEGRPVVGYHGAISYWFDVDLLAEVAGRRPDLAFVLVGPVDPRVADEVRRLDELPNVHLLGERHPDDIPAYVQAFDVGAIWFRLTPMTEGVTPLKMYEYLAAGVPVVSTPLPAARDEAEVTVAGDADTAVAAIDAALATAHDPASRRRRRSVAERAAWGARLAPALARLDEMGRRRVPEA